ncbi:GDP-fucose transporter 1 [Prorops nasuta]|uniref:GDP-fucose transporter 1 n=1 Tax=Prorops nasuta TaxID=863751 RepID=UPI0034CE4F28
MDLREKLLSEQVKQDQKLFYKYLYITFVIAIYWITSILTVFINKTLLSSRDISLEAPLFITWFQCIVSVIICLTLSTLSKAFPRFIQFPKGDPWKTETLKKILPLSLLFVSMIATNNLCLKYVGVAFYFVGRSLTTVFNVLFTFLILGQKTPPKCIACCFLIIFGFWLGVDQENVAGSLSSLGVIYGILGSVSVSLYSIKTKQVLPFVNQDIWLLSYYNNVYSIIIFIPLMLFYGEHQTILNYDKFGYNFFWFALIMGGIFGFAIGYVTTLQIQVTSPLTHNISGTAKACAQTVIATYWFNEKKTFLWWISNFVVLGGSAAYTRLRQINLSNTHKNNVQQSKV